MRAGQQHVEIHLGNVFEQLDVDVLGVEILRQPAAGAEMEDDDQPLVDRHFDRLGPEAAPEPAAIAHARHVAAAVDFQPIENRQVDGQVHPPVAAVFERLIDFDLRQADKITPGHQPLELFEQGPSPLVELLGRQLAARPRVGIGIERRIGVLQFFERGLEIAVYEPFPEATKAAKVGRFFGRQRR